MSAMSNYHEPSHDPAPSRWSYRLLRLMLTPFLRRLVLFGIPAFALAAGIGLYLSEQDNRDKLRMLYNEVRLLITQHPELMVNLMAIEGASDMVDQDIREVLPVDFPISYFDLDLPQMREVIIGLDPVKDAVLQLSLGAGILQIEVTERVPAAIWRHRGGLELLDETGAYVRTATSRQDYKSLPLIAGIGADTQVQQALELMKVGQPLAERIRGLVYMGARRWDVVLDNNQRLMLPEQQPVETLERIIALDQAENLLSRDLTAVDFRLVDRPTLRLVDRAMTDFRNITFLKLGDQ